MQDNSSTEIITKDTRRELPALLEKTSLEDYLQKLPLLCQEARAQWRTIFGGKFDLRQFRLFERMVSRLFTHVKEYQFEELYDILFPLEVAVKSITQDEHSPTLLELQEINRYVRTLEKQAPQVVEARTQSQSNPPEPKEELKPSVYPPDSEEDQQQPEESLTLVAAQLDIDGHDDEAEEDLTLMFDITDLQMPQTEPAPEPETEPEFELELDFQLEPFVVADEAVQEPPVVPELDLLEFPETVDNNISIEPAEPAATAGWQEKRLGVYVRLMEGFQRDLLGLSLSANGIEVEYFERIDELRQAVITREPCAVIIEPAGVDDFDDVKAIRAEGEGFSLFVVSENDDIHYRLAALRAGCDAFYPLPLDIPGMMAQVRGMHEANDNPFHNILLINSDTTAANKQRKLFLHQGYKLKYVSSALAGVEVAQAFSPDLILMSDYEADLDVVEFTALMKQYRPGVYAPLLVLSDDSDTKGTTACRLGYPLEYLPSSVSPSRLLELVQARALRHRQSASVDSCLKRLDADTGLYRRDYLLAMLAEKASAGNGGANEAQRFSALLYISINDFGFVRQVTGEQYLGVLKARVAQLIRSAIADEDIPASCGDNAFCILVQRESLNELESLAGTLCELLGGAPLDYLNGEVALKVTIGIAQIIGDDFSRVILNAMQAAAMVRSAEDSRFMLHQDLHQKMINSDHIRYWFDQLHNAIDEERLFLVYQPITGLTVDDKERYEVLLRMKDTGGHVVRPNEFIGIAKKYDYMRTLDQWVISTALKKLSEYQRKRKGTTFYIKLSTDTIVDDSFADWLGDMLNQYPVESNTAVFEITEKDIKFHPADTTSLAKRLRELNCSIAIEHFGNAEDSLNLLNYCKTDYLKLDHQLINGLEQSREKQEIVKRITSAAMARGVKTLASYIENAASLDILWRNGIGYLQGDFLQRPDEKMSFDFEGLII